MAPSPPSSGSGLANGGDAVLVLNAGSSSIKAAVLAPDDSLLWRDQRSGVWGEQAGPPEERAGLEDLLASWLVPALAPWRSRLGLIGHRVVHGGDRFTVPTRLDEPVLEALAQLVPLAPLHNGPALRVMRWLTEWDPALPQWACFDTAFHSTLPPEEHTYAIPLAWRQRGLRRYGFHGLNHQHVSEVVQQRFGRSGPAGPLRLISCHLGAGCSLCAIRGGVSVATTMGFTPMEGLVMATRSGSVDPGLLLHLLRQGVPPGELDRELNAASGLLALSALSGDMRELRSRAGLEPDAEIRSAPSARLAIAVFRHRLLQGLGAMAASLGGVDVIALTGGIGEHDEALRRELEASLGWLAPFSLVTVPADEEGLIARSCRLAHAGAGG